MNALANVRSGNLMGLKTLVLTDQDINVIKDDNNDSLLHLATHSENAEIVEYLLSKGACYTTLNKFGKSSWDLAVMIRNKSVMQKYISYMIRSNGDHVIEVNNFKRVNSRLVLENTELKLENTELKSENTELKKGVKTLRDENEKLTTDNNGLIQKNKKLRISVETLMENSKKK